METRSRTLFAPLCGSLCLLALSASAQPFTLADPAWVGHLNKPAAAASAEFIVSTDAALGANGGALPTIDTTGANLIVVSVAWFPAGTFTDITDNKSNTYLELPAVDDTATRQRLFYCIGATTGSGHVVTVNATGVYCSAQLVAFSNISAIDSGITNANVSGAGTTVQPGSVTPSQDKAVLVAGVTFEGVGRVIESVDSGWTLAEATTQAAEAQGGAIAYKILTSAAANNPTFTGNGSASAAAGTIASFKY
jgi:hypothetical protein